MPRSKCTPCKRIHSRHTQTFTRETHTEQPITSKRSQTHQAIHFLTLDGRLIVDGLLKRYLNDSIYIYTEINTIPQFNSECQK